MMRGSGVTVTTPQYNTCCSKKNGKTYHKVQKYKIMYTCNKSQVNLLTYKKILSLITKGGANNNSRGQSYQKYTCCM